MSPEPGVGDQLFGGLLILAGFISLVIAVVLRARKPSGIRPYHIVFLVCMTVTFVVAGFGMFGEEPTWVNLIGGFAGLTGILIAYRTR